MLLWVIVCQVLVYLTGQLLLHWNHSHFLIILSCPSHQVSMIEQQNHLFDIHRWCLPLSLYLFTLIQWRLSDWTNIYTVSDTVDQGSSSHFCLLSHVTTSLFPIYLLNFILIFFPSCCSLYSCNLSFLLLLCLFLLQNFSSFVCLPFKYTRTLRNSICRSRHSEMTL